MTVDIFSTEENQIEHNRDDPKLVTLLFKRL